MAEGHYRSHGDDADTAETVATWIKLPPFLDWMSRKATAAGHPDAAEEIALDIGSRTHTWLELNASELKDSTALDFLAPSSLICFLCCCGVYLHDSTTACLMG